jgi:hypothetical protein
MERFPFLERAAWTVNAALPTSRVAVGFVVPLCPQGIVLANFRTVATVAQCHFFLRFVSAIPHGARRPFREAFADKAVVSVVVDVEVGAHGCSKWV